MVEQRKIKKIDDFYIALKPIKSKDGWEKIGKKYDCKGLVNLLQGDIGIEFILSKEVKQDIEEYKKMCLERKLNYLKSGKYGSNKFCCINNYWNDEVMFL